MTVTRLGILTLFALAACRDTGPRTPLFVTIAANKTVLVPGERIDLTVVAKNVSTETQVVRPGCNNYFRVFEAQTGREVAPVYGFCLAILNPDTQLAPGETAVFGSVWDELESDHGTGVPLKSGEYLIMGRVFTPDGPVSGRGGLVMHANDVGVARPR